MCFFWPFGIFCSSGRRSFLVLSAPWHAGSPPGPRAQVWALAEVRGTCSGGPKWQVPSGNDSEHVEPSRCEGLALARSSAPSGPRPAGHGRGQGRVPSQTPSWQTGSSLHPIVMSINDPTDTWIDKTSNFWPLEDHHYAEVFAVRASFKTDDPPLWSGLLSPSARAAALRENRGHCFNCHEDTHAFRNCRHPFIDASGCLNPELGQLGDDDAYRRWKHV